MSQFRNIKEIKNIKMNKVKDSRSKMKAKEYIIIGDAYENSRKRDQSKY